MKSEKNMSSNHERVHRVGAFFSFFLNPFIYKVIGFILVIIFFFVPIFRLIFMGFTNEAGFTIEYYTTILKEERTWKVLKNTVIIVGVSTLISTILGTLFAWIIAYTDIRLKKMIQLFVFLPFVIPSYITSLAWAQFFGPTGLIKDIMKYLHINFSVWDLYSLSGIIFVMGISNFPLVYLFSVNVFRKIPREMELAGRISGSSGTKTFMKIVFPMALPGIVGGTFIAFLASLDNFGIPAFLGTPANISVLSTYIYQQVIGFGSSAFNYAAVLSTILGIIAVAGIGMQWLVLRKTKRLETTKIDYEPRYFLGRKKLLVEIMIWFFFILTSVLPMLSMIITSFLKAYGLDFNLENISLKNYAFILTSKSTSSAIFTSIKLASITAIVGIFIGTAFAYLRVRKNRMLTKITETSITIPYALPGTVFAISMIFNWMEPIPGWNPGIYGTSAILYIAYITRFLILQVRSGVTAFQQVDIEIEEAARISGSNGFGKWRKIMIPLITPGLLGGALLVFLSALTELTVSSLLYSSESETIGVSILSFQQSGYTLYSTAFSSIIVTLIILGYILLFFVQQIWNRKVVKKK